MVIELPLPVHLVPMQPLMEQQQQCPCAHCFHQEWPASPYERHMYMVEMEYPYPSPNMHMPAPPAHLQMLPRIVG